ncbi:hypothetical protein A5710_12210 [Mycolicibacter sinensis]|uniref:Mammalian cell entry protein n=1 Tax=Mycolicibacter sinensis (strain JDM601) TaxID=875328 RepID=A0A1A2NWY9_MYCSD|nr:hypothetical protein A5694_18300 [Mycolicibacter sinensis]OBI34190.1 hypothetical protein A5710_12210 [Mycolicibacter sinensis]
MSRDADDEVVEPGATTAEAATTEGEDDEKPVAKKGSHAHQAPPAKPAKAAKGAMFSSYGLVSAFLGLVAVAALVFSLITWNMHRGDVDERSYRSRVLQTAASWTSVLINLNAENVEKGMARLRDKTVGELNSEFDAALAPYRDVVQKIQSRSSGRIEAVAIETERHNLDDPAATTEQAPSPGRTDPVMVIATSIAENVGGRPQTVHWALHLDVSDVDGHLMISRLRSIR